MGGILISLTVNNLEGLYEIYKNRALTNLSEIRHLEDIGLKPFFFKGPESYDFEIQEFTNLDLMKLF